MKPSKKTLVIAISFLLIGIIVTSVAWVFAQPSSTFYITSGVYPSSATYTIFREDSTYYAKNAFGAIPYFGTNLTEVVEDVQDNLPFLEGGNKGLIHFSAGSFMWNTPLSLQMDVIYEGEGAGTSMGNTGDVGIFYAEDADRMVIRNMKFSAYGSEDINLIHLRGGRTILLESLYVVRGGSASNITGILVEGTISSTIRNNEIQGFGDSLSEGIRIKNWVGVNPTYTIDICYNQFYNNYDDILITEGFTHNLRILYNSFTVASDHCIRMDGAVYHLDISHNYFEQTTTSAIALRSTEIGSSSSIDIQQNYFIGGNNVSAIDVGVTDSTYYVFGAHITENMFQFNTILNLTNRSYNTQVKNNQFDGLVMIDNGGKNRFEGNINFHTEESGSGTDTSPITVTYKIPFAIAPNAVVLTPQGATTYQTSYTTTTTTLTIYHNAGGSITVSYYAKYEP